MYDRYYSFDKKPPFDYLNGLILLKFDLNIPLNFIHLLVILSTRKFRKPVINKDAEIVGLAFDGNIESLDDNFIYNTNVPHTVSVDSEGMMEVIKDLFNLKPLSEELRTGKLYTE